MEQVKILRNVTPRRSFKRICRDVKHLQETGVCGQWIRGCVTENMHYELYGPVILNVLVALGYRPGAERDERGRPVFLTLPDIEIDHESGLPNWGAMVKANARATETFAPEEPPGPPKNKGGRPKKRGPKTQRKKEEPPKRKGRPPKYGPHRAPKPEEPSKGGPKPKYTKREFVPKYPKK